MLIILLFVNLRTIFSFLIPPNGNFNNHFKINFPYSAHEF